MLNVNPVFPFSGSNEIETFCRPVKLLINHASKHYFSKKKKVLTHMLLPKMHCGWQLLPGSSVPRRRRLPRPVCSAARERYAGRRASRWAAACGANGSRLCPSPPALHPCTTPLSGSAAPLLYSWGWRVPPWRQSGQRGAPQSGVGSPPGADGILEEKRRRVIKNSGTVHTWKGWFSIWLFKSNILKLETSSLNTKER